MCDGFADGHLGFGDGLRNSFAKDIVMNWIYYSLYAGKGIESLFGTDS